MKKVAFYTLGCRVNQYETNAFAEEFIKRGWTVGKFDEDCDLYVVNTCAVTEESGRKSRQIIRRAAKRGEVAVVGCYSQLCPDKIKSINGVVRVGGNVNKLKAVLGDEDEYFDFSNPFYEPLCVMGKTDLFSSCRAYVKIQDGCPNKCSYCIIPKVRGPVRSRPLVDIICECKKLVSAGYSEVVLTGIEVSAYTGAPLWQVITEVSKVEGLKRLRLGSLTPTCLDDSLLRALADSKVFCRHIHLSVQSGCTRILNLMRRKYNKEMLEKVVDRIRQYLPDVTLSADIITGFPTETEEEFLETVEFCLDKRFMHIHSFPYSPRPDTDAAKMDGQVDKNIREQRNEMLIKRTGTLRNQMLSEYVGRSLAVLTEKVSDFICTGHTEGFIECRFTGNAAVGELVTVDITSVSDGCLQGVIK